MNVLRMQAKASKSSYHYLVSHLYHKYRVNVVGLNIHIYKYLSYLFVLESVLSVYVVVFSEKTSTRL